MNLVALVAAAALAGLAAGWLARGADAPAAPAPAVAAAPTRAASAPAGPLVLVSGDGQVTLRVEQQPLEWVLEQIAVQSGWRDVHARAEAVAAPASAASAPAFADTAESDAGVACAPPLADAATAARLLQSIGSADEGERFDALLRTRSDAVVVPETTLQALMEADPSERVRLAAFERLLESRVEPAPLRSALEAALSAGSAAVREEARRRLAELQDLERLDARYPQGGS